MNGKNNKISLKRWNSLNKNIGKTIERIPVDPDFPQKVTLESFLKALRAFAQSQFDFFYNGFYGRNGADPFLEESKLFPPEFVIRKTLYQIEYDLTVIKQAINQRKNDGEREALKKADALAYRALEPAITAGLLPNTAVITYFHKASDVRVIPYAPIALIGLPFSAIDTFIEPVVAAEGVAADDGAAIGNDENDTNLRDFLAIPHEIGHYVYWHGHINKSRLAIELSNRLKKQPKWLEKWLEEIFADIYGALIAGPAMALNFQELQKDFFKPLKFTKDDGQHPIPAIRPYIYTEILRQVEFYGQSPFAKVANDLDSEWIKWLTKYDVPEEFKPSDETVTFTRDALPVEIKEIIDIAYKALQLVKLRNDLSGFWSSAQTNDGLFAEFFKYVGALDLNQEILNLPKVTVDANDNLTIDAEVWAKIGKTRLAIDALKNGIDTQYKMLPEAWMVVFSMRGWTVAGPTGNPPVGD